MRQTNRVIDKKHVLINDRQEKLLKMSIYFDGNKQTLTGANLKRLQMKLSLKMSHASSTGYKMVTWSSK